MTTRRKPSQPRNSISEHDEAHLPWYKSLTVWLGIVITGLVLAGCIWIVTVSHQYAGEDVRASATDQDGLTEVLGMPLSRGDTADSNAIETTDNP